MDLWEAIVIAFRRWYLVVPVLVGGLILGQYVADSVSPIYRADATLQYRIPFYDQSDEEAVLGVNSNPYTNISTLIVATEVAAKSDLIAIDLAQQGYADIAYSVTSAQRTPLLYIKTESTSRDSAVGGLDALVEIVQADAVARQTEAIGSTPEYFVQVEVLLQDFVPSTDLTSRTRTRVLMGAVAVIFAVVAAVAIESLIGHLRRRREGDDADADSEQPGVVWFGLPVSGGQAVQPPPQQLTAVSGGSEWRDDRIRDAAAGDVTDDGEPLRPTGSEKRRTRWAR
jgi:hypothetical protein